MEWFKSELNSRLGWNLDAPFQYDFLNPQRIDTVGIRILTASGISVYLLKVVVYARGQDRPYARSHQ